MLYMDFKQLTNQQYGTNMCLFNSRREHFFIHRLYRMGESGTVIISPGTGELKTSFEDRGLEFAKENESISVSQYSVYLKDGEDGFIKSEMTASECYI